MRWKGAPITTKGDLAHMALVRARGCVCCAFFNIKRSAVIHHIKQGNKRMGHRFVLPLCPGHHVGEFTEGQHYGEELSVHRHRYAFIMTFGTERMLWEKVQKDLGLPITGWPTSKILPRRGVA